ncbi:SufD family Fe-S cluster assembly protein [Candidatus Woesearchaeota archaeon]|nr:SufD family Fe-S cluster assembly protein [Candidatus Woesearchaeota archaeon]
MRIDTLFNGEGSQSENLGVFVGRSREHIDITTNVYHNTAHTTNNIMVDGILKDSSSSVYRGLIRIEKAGQQTNSYLSNHILKIGEKSLGNSIPALEIEANDVKASHGATVGQVSEEHLFYLMSRGLTREDAENMIVQGFLEPIISKIPSEELREKIRGLITR